VGERPRESYRFSAALRSAAMSDTRTG